MSLPKASPATSDLNSGNAYWMARIAREVYKSVSVQDDRPDEEAILNSLKTDDPRFIKVFGVNNNSAQAALIEHEDYYCVAFRGTDEIADWLDNINAILVDEPYGEFHRGFLNSVDDVWEPLITELREWRWNSPKPLMLTGHSLGGAMASIFTFRLLEMDIPFRSVYTFGQPRAMSDDTAEEFNEMCKQRYFRFHNNNDLVTRVPARIAGYSHVGTYLYISDEKEIYENPGFWFRFMDYVDGAIDAIGDKGIDGIEDHSMNDYLEAIRRWSFKN